MSSKPAAGHMSGESGRTRTSEWTISVNNEVFSPAFEVNVARTNEMGNTSKTFPTLG